MTEISDHDCLSSSTTLIRLLSFECVSSSVLFFQTRTRTHVVPHFAEFPIVSTLAFEHRPSPQCAGLKSFFANIEHIANSPTGKTRSLHFSQLMFFRSHVYNKHPRLHRSQKIVCFCNKPTVSTFSSQPAILVLVPDENLRTAVRRPRRATNYVAIDFL